MKLHFMQLLSKNCLNTVLVSQNFVVFVKLYKFCRKGLKAFEMAILIFAIHCRIVPAKCFKLVEAWSLLNSTFLVQFYLFGNKI